MILKLNSKDKADVMQLQSDLNDVGIKTEIDGIFGKETEKNLIKFQKLHSLKKDGEYGPITKAVMDIAINKLVDDHVKNVVKDGPPKTLPPVQETPWMDFMTERIGWTEFDHDKELSKYWPLVNLSYKTVIGTVHSWCALMVNAALFNTGFKGNRRADALSFEHYGTPCDYVFGAIIPIRHANGHSHVTFFRSWEDKDKRIMNGLGGNQSNMIKISKFNLSGNQAGHDECVSGPRWPVKA